MPVRIGSVVSLTTFCVSAESSFHLLGGGLELFVLMGNRGFQKLGNRFRLGSTPLESLSVRAGCLCVTLLVK
jgi:hypothetical protein